MMNKCCIKGCQSSYYTAVGKANVKSVFKVPKDVSMYKYFMENVCNDRELERWVTSFFCTNNSQEHNKRMFVETIYMHNARFSLLTLVDIPFASLSTRCIWSVSRLQSRDSLDVYRYARVQAVGNTHAQDARRIFIYIHGDMAMRFFHCQARGRWRQAPSVLFTHTPLNS